MSGTKQTPSIVDQALEASKDEPTRTELTNMLLDLPCVDSVSVDGENNHYRPTIISVYFGDRHGDGTGPVTRIMRRAGWEQNAVTFSIQRISFTEVGGETPATSSTGTERSGGESR